MLPVLPDHWEYRVIPVELREGIAVFFLDLQVSDAVGPSIVIAATLAAVGKSL